MSLARAVQQHIAAKNVCIFSFTYCPFCVKAKDLVSKYTTDIEYVQMDTHEEGDNFHEAVIKASGCGHDTAPATWIKGKFVGGFSDLAALEQQGKLEELLK